MVVAAATEYGEKNLNGSASAYVERNVAFGFFFFNYPP